MIQYDTRLNESRRIYMIKEREVNETHEYFCHGAKDIFDVCMNGLHMDTLSEEYVYCFCLDGDGRILGFFEISHGTINNSLVSPREVYQKALLIGATGIILVHNHPSGNPDPSKQDFEVTKKLLAAGQIIDVRFLDHVIIGKDRYYSFLENDDEKLFE